MKVDDRRRKKNLILDDVMERTPTKSWQLAGLPNAPRLILLVATLRDVRICVRARFLPYKNLRLGNPRIIYHNSRPC